MSQPGQSAAPTALAVIMMIAIFATAYFFLDMTWLVQPISSVFVRLAALLGV